MEMETDSGNESNELEQIALRKAFATLRDKAYGYLVRREHSASELREKLVRWDEHDLRDYLIEKLIEDGAQSDARFAEHLGRVRTGAGKGPRALQRELQQHLIDPDIIEEVMETYRNQWSALAEQARSRKFGAELPTDYKEWARQARFLQQRGFAAEHVRRAT